MNNNVKVIVLAGGIGPEREVSVSTGKALTNALEKNYPVELIDLTKEKLPKGINPETTVVFPAIHRRCTLFPWAGFSY